MGVCLRFYGYCEDGRPRRSEAGAAATLNRGLRCGAAMPLCSGISEEEKEKANKEKEKEKEKN
jgi:hypothetical protein